MASLKFLKGVNNNNNDSDEKEPKITNYYCIPLRLKRRLDNNDSVDLSDDYKLINPNIHMLFDKYNKLFFDNKLKSVTLRWDYREKLNAGICRQNGDKINITLSQQLLQYRASKDLIETLIHESIHSYLFVKSIHHLDKTHHGARFLTIMNVINYICKPCKLSLSTRHDYLSEVNAMKSHEWKCNGMCSQTIYRPFTRPPGPHEKWWKRHTNECGGKYQIIGFNKNKNNLDSNEWKEKKLLKRREKEKKRRDKKKHRADILDQDSDNDKKWNKTNKRKRENKYKITLE